MKQPFLETQRLYMKRTVESDFTFVKGVYGDSRMMKLLGGAQSEAVIQRRFDEYLKHWEQFGHGPCIAVLKTTGARVGIFGLQYETIEGETCPELGWMVMPEYQRQGYAFECAKAYLDYGLNHLHFKKVKACPDPGNAASIRIIEKLGLSFDRMVSYSYGDSTLQLMAWVLEVD